MVNIGLLNLFIFYVINLFVFKLPKELKNGPSSEQKQLNGENKGPSRNEDVLIKVVIT